MHQGQRYKSFSTKYSVKDPAEITHDKCEKAFDKFKSIPNIIQKSVFMSLLKKM